MPRNQIHRSLKKQAGRLAAFISHDLAAQRVSRVRIYPRQPQGRVIRPAAMPAARIKKNWMRRRRPIQVRHRRQLPTPI